MDWDTPLREANGNVNPLGLVDLDRRLRPVGRRYARLEAQWRNILTVESPCLDMVGRDCPPAVTPSLPT